MHVGKGRIVARFPEARMIGNDDLKAIGPGFGEVAAFGSAAAVEEDERLAPADRLHDRLHTVDGVRLAREIAHCLPRRPYSAAARSAGCTRARSRGITSSAISVRFFTVFQCGMSATCMTQLMWLVFIHCAHSPS